MKKIRFLHELVEFLHEDEIPEKKSILVKHELDLVLNDYTASGGFWERVLSKAMRTHTERCQKRNEKGKDYLDNTDAKFAMAGNYSDSTQKQFTISHTNKIGTLRVCLCIRGKEYHKVYFLKIPYEAYQNMLGQNIKITLSDFSPSGEIWDRYNCSWEEVISPMVDNNAK